MTSHLFISVHIQGHKGCSGTEYVMHRDKLMS